MKTIKLENDWDNIEDFKEAMSGKTLSVWVMFESFTNSKDGELTMNDLNTWQNILKPYGVTFSYGMDLVCYDFELSMTENKQFKPKKRRSLYDRLKPEIKKELIKESENMPVTVKSIITHLRQYDTYLLVPYGVYSQLTTIVNKDDFADYFND